MWTQNTKLRANVADLIRNLNTKCDVCGRKCGFTHMFTYENITKLNFCGKSCAEEAGYILIHGCELEYTDNTFEFEGEIYSCTEIGATWDEKEKRWTYDAEYVREKDIALFGEVPK